MKSKPAKFIMLLIPLLTSWLSWSFGLYFLYFVSYILAFLCIGLCRYCRRHESIWLFVLAGLSSVPMNIKISLYISMLFIDSSHASFILVLLMFLLTYAIIFSLLEIVLGIVGRMIWRDQCPFIEQGFEYDESNIYSMLKQDDNISDSA